VPITQAAEEIKNSHGTVVRNTDILMKDLQREFHRQNEENRNQIVQLHEVNRRLEVLLTGISTSAESQGREAQSLSAHVSSLAQNVASLSGVLGSASRTFELSERQVAQLAALERQSKDLVDVVNASTRRSEQQATEVRTFTDRLGDLIREVASLGGRMSSSQRSQQRQEPVYQPQASAATARPISPEGDREGGEGSWSTKRTDQPGTIGETAESSLKTRGARSGAPSTTVQWEPRDPAPPYGERRPDVREPTEWADRVATTTAFVGQKRARPRNWFLRMAESVGGALGWHRRNNRGQSGKRDSGERPDSDTQTDASGQSDAARQSDGSGHDDSSSQSGGSELADGSVQTDSGGEGDRSGESDSSGKGNKNG
jgi:hypothetical protein